MTRYQFTLYGILIAATALSLAHPPFPDQAFLQHIPTLIALIGFPFFARRYPMTDTAVTCWTIFLLLHIVAARWIYSFVPYDHWSERLFGINITAHFGFKRNHFDRLVHFSFGLLWIRPMFELLRRHARFSQRAAYYVSFEFVLAASMLYELVEWVVALALAPADASAYNGQQGDMWDAQKDMFSAMLGASLALVAMMVRGRGARPPIFPAS